MYGPKLIIRSCNVLYTKKRYLTHVLPCNNYTFIKLNKSSHNCSLQHKSIKITNSAGQVGSVESGLVGSRVGSWVGPKVIFRLTQAVHMKLYKTVHIYDI